ncbi:TPA_asm: Oncoid1 [Manila clam xenomavirus]|nr:TPA_asm: Oncoid1 [Manila clam xenomavirus]
MYFLQQEGNLGMAFQFFDADSPSDNYIYKLDFYDQDFYLKYIRKAKKILKHRGLSFEKIDIVLLECTCENYCNCPLNFRVTDVTRTVLRLTAPDYETSNAIGLAMKECQDLGLIEKLQLICSSVQSNQQLPLNRVKVHSKFSGKTWWF